MGEKEKLQQHLTLLREEYVKLQNRLVEVERRAEIAEAAAGTTDSAISRNSFVSRLVRTVAELFEKDLFSDITIHLDGHQLRSHRFVLGARSDHWGVADLAVVDHLELEDLSYNIGHTMLRWVYTDNLDEKLGDSFVLDLMKAAKRFELVSLFDRCESILVSRLEFGNCIKFYQIADEIDAAKLRDHCSQIISLHWDRFTYVDFEEMSAPLLYKMLRVRTEFLLHAAIKLKREDVVFLYLVDYNAELSRVVNQKNDDGELPLAMALFSGQESLARTLLSHKANVNAKDGNDKTCLIRAIEDENVDVASFLLDAGADVDTIQPGTNRTLLHLIALADTAYSVCKADAPYMKPSAILPVKAPRERKAENLVEIATMVIEKKSPNVNIQDWMGDTPLHLVIKHNRRQLFDAMLSGCDDTDAANDGCVNASGWGSVPNLTLHNNDGHAVLWCSLNSALDKGFYMARRLIQLGADINDVQEVTGNSLLQMCIENNLEDGALFLLSHKIDVDHANRKGQTALHLACSGGLKNICQRLLSEGANPNAQTLEDPTDPFAPHHQTPLHLAIASLHRDILSIFLDFRASCRRQPKSGLTEPNFSLVDSTGESALGFSLWSGYFDIGKELINGGADVNMLNNEGLSLLHRAIEKPDADSALFLIQNGADVNQKTPENESCVQLAVRSHLPGVVRALCNTGADLNDADKADNPPVWNALDSGQEDIASILVEFGADRDFWHSGPGGCQQTLLHKAIDENNEAVGAFLVRSLCDLNATRRPGPNGEGDEEAHDRQTPLHMASTWGLEAVVRALVEHGADVNAQDVEGKTPVHLAVLNQHEEILSVLLRAPGLNLSLRDRKALTPFATAMAAKNNKAAGVILGKDPKTAYQTDNKGCNFLHSAIKNGDLEAVLFLLSVHMDVNIPVQDSSRWTPLHLAAKTGDEMIVRNLLLAGANVNAMTSTKQTPLHIACENDRSSIVSIVLDQGADFDAADSVLNNALHISCQTGSISCVRTLLSESKINADATNMKGQNPLHMLAQYGRDNAATIFDLFLEFIPTFPIDRPDADGSTVLLIAYMHGNAQLCKAAVRAGACIGVVNLHGTSLFSYQVATKQLLYRLLDQLSREPRWAEGENCSECNLKFTITIRKHHCRHCGRMICSKCSEHTMPILKYDLQKPVRVCDVCFDVLTMGAQ